MVQLQQVLLWLCVGLWTLRHGDGLRRPIIINGKRIVGGSTTIIDRLPFLVNVRRSGNFICGGTIIAHNCILTAAHCVQGVPAEAFSVHAGANRLTELSPSVRQVSELFVSPDYNSNTLDMDVAILKLATPIDQPDNKKISSIGLCARSPSEQQLVQIAGWGATDEADRQPVDQVRTAMVRVVGWLACQRDYLLQARLTANMFCATVAGKRDSCSGDSGDPVAFEGRVCGIVSWGFGCARPNYPGVYTNISSRCVRSFIESTRSRNCK